MENIDVDEIFERTGPFGRFQLIIVVLAYLSAIVPGLITLNDVYVNFTPNFRCYVPNCDSDDSSYIENFLNYTTPYDTPNLRWEQCQTFVQYDNNTIRHLAIRRTSIEYCTQTNFDSSEREDCAEDSIFDTSEISSSTVIDYQLTCDRAFQAALLNSMVMVGMLCGSFFVGYIGDTFGRRIAFLVSILVVMVGGFAEAASSTLWLIFLMRFLTGFAINGIFVSAFIYCVEFVVPKHRVACGILVNVPFAIGSIFLALIASAVNDNWRILLVITTSSIFPLLVICWYLPESIRWLLSQGRYDDAMEVIKRVCKANNREFPQDLFLPKPSNKDLTQISDTDSRSSHSEKKDKSLLDMLKLPNMRKRILISFMSWGSVTLAYYGLAANSAKLGNNSFTSFILSSLIEIPSYFFAWLVLDRLGRKGTLSLTFFIAGVFCIIVGCLPADMTTVIVVFSMIGKFGTAAAFSIIYIYTSEIFPTEYRSIGIGSCSTCARIGGILAPLVTNLGNTVYPPLPFFVFGVTALISGFLTLLMPETTGLPLPETLEESERLGRDQSILYFTCFKKKRNTSSISRSSLVSNEVSGTEATGNERF